MVGGCTSMMAFHRVAWRTPAMPERGRGILSGSAPSYRTYRCADGRYVAVGALERPLFERLWRTLGFEEPVPDDRDPRRWPELERRFSAAFASADRDAWAARFAGVDACVTPVLAPDEVVDADDGEAAALVRDETEAILRAAGASEAEIAAAVDARRAVASEPAPWPPQRP
jgi:alpha-methylacyl-CoA racemase